MTSIWELYNLQGNPFFQDPLGSDIVVTLPPLDSLFVGREEELAFAERLITHDSRTRVVITGEAGVGKTTFLNRLRERLETLSTADRRYITHTPALRIQGEWTAVDLCAEILRTILLMRSKFEGDVGKCKPVAPGFLSQLSGISRVFGQAMTAPSFWERVAQVVEGRQMYGVGVQGGTAVAHGGASFHQEWAPPVIIPATLLLLTIDAIRLASEELGAELVFVLNNLENLSREDASRAAGLFQDVRDLFLTERSHWIVCGTNEVDRLILRASVQVGGIFGAPLALQPLAPNNVSELLTRRYHAFARPGTRPIPPVDPETGARLYRLYHGNLRHFLQLLQDAVLRGAGPGGARPISLEKILRLMGHEHVRAMQERLGKTSWYYFQETVLGKDIADALWGSFRQVDAARRTQKKASVIKRHMDSWMAAGYLIADPAVPVRRDDIGNRGEWMRLSGTAAVGFSALAMDMGKDIAPLFDEERTSK